MNCTDASSTSGPIYMIEIIMIDTAILEFIHFSSQVELLEADDSLSGYLEIKLVANEFGTEKLQSICN